MNGSGGTSTGTGELTTSGTIVTQADFQEQTIGTYSQAMVEEDFGFATTWNNGLDEGRAAIEEENGNRLLRVTYPANQYGPSDGGVQFQVPFGKAYGELYLHYRVRFGAGFEFVKGGKLPGLVGGSAPTGCTQQSDGFSARNMWRAEGAAVQYIYYPLNPESCGHDFPYEKSGVAVHFSPGTWHAVQHRIVMNDVGSANGVMQAWFDGDLVLDEQSFTWVTDPYPDGNGADTLYFSTFFGGSGSDWAPQSDQIIDFDDFMVSTGPIN